MTASPSCSSIVVRRRLRTLGFSLLRAAVPNDRILSGLSAATVRARDRPGDATDDLSTQLLLRQVVDLIAPGYQVIGVRPRISRAWAPSAPPHGALEDLPRDSLRFFVACEDAIGHNAQIQVLRRSRSRLASLGPSGDESRVSTIPMRRGDVLMLAPEMEVGAHPNHTAHARVMLEVVVAAEASRSPSLPSEPRGGVGGSGFEVIDLFDRSDVAAMSEVVGGFGLPEYHGFFASPKDACGARARTADLALRAQIGSKVEAGLPGHQVFMTAVTSKGAGGGTAVDFHQDWTYVDERDFRTIFIWCPLVDTSRRNGGLAIVPGSWKWVDRIRPSRVLPQPVVTERHQAAYSAMSVALDVPAGAAVMFDPATIHGSSANPTADPRPALTFALAPTCAPLVHFHEDPCGVLTGYEVDDAFFTAAPFRERPVGFPPLHPWEEAISESDLERAILTHGTPDAIGTLVTAKRNVGGR